MFNQRRQLTPDIEQDRSGGRRIPAPTVASGASRAQSPSACHTAGRPPDQEDESHEDDDLQTAKWPLRSTAQRGLGGRVIKAQDRHLKEIVASEDTEHQSALQDMKGRWKDPIAGMGWYWQVKRDFKALP